jgi:peptidoglycan/LPS O-acetylase OafA/YrhL
MAIAAELRPLKPPLSAPVSGSGYLPTLDGWRAVAICGVLIAHTFDGDWAKRGSIGVNIFFGLSGFLICSRLLTERRRTGRISLRAFYVRRAFRILPPALTYLGALAVLSACGILATSRGEFLGCLLFFRNYLPLTFAGSDAWYTGHFWSLSVEEHFYLFWPAFLIVVGSRRARWGAVALALVVAVWRIVEFRHRWVDRFLVGPVPGFYLRTDVSLDGMFWGCWVALLLDDTAWRARLGRWLSPPVWFGFLAGFVACVLIRFPLYNVAYACLIPLLLSGTVLRPESSAARLLETAPFRWVGRLSYSLYLWQQLFLVASPSGVLATRPDLRSSLLLHAWPWNILATFACASASFYLIERPLVRLGQRLSARLGPALPAPNSACEERAPIADRLPLAPTRRSTLRDRVPRRAT